MCIEYRDKMWRVIIDMRIRMGGSMSVRYLCIEYEYLCRI